MKYLSYITRTDPKTGEMTPHEGKRKVFISYKHSDEAKLPICRKLASYILEKLDVAVWYDSELTAGEEYDKEIRRAISSSDALVWLLTPEVLESAYVVKWEIPYAVSNSVSVIPLIAGLLEADIPRVEQIIGRVHMPLWFFGEKEEVPSFPSESLKQFICGLSLSIANRDLLSQSEIFCKRGGHKLSMRYLTPEQVFIKAYGCLFGVSPDDDKSLGVKLMESILSGYGTDDDFVSLQKQVAIELLLHLYRSNQPEMFFSCFRLIHSKSIDKSKEMMNPFVSGSSSFVKSIYDVLFGIYRNKFHPEMLRFEDELSMIMFKQCYFVNFGKEWDASSSLKKLENSESFALDSLDTSCEKQKFGEIRAGEHTLFFQKSVKDEKAVELVADGRIVMEYPLYASFGDVYTAFLAYDSCNNLVLTLHSDFDHYGVETCTTCTAFRFEGENVRVTSFSSEWLKARRLLPYDPYFFNIK